MNHTLVIAILATVFLGLTSGSAAGEMTPAQVRAQDENTIKKITLDRIERFNRHLPAEAADFTQDADFVNAQGLRMKGAAGINRGHKKELAVVLKDSKLILLDLSIRFIRPDVVIVHQTQDLSGKRDPNGNEIPTQRQINIRVLVKEQGKWLTTAFQNTIVLPAALPAPAK